MTMKTDRKTIAKYILTVLTLAWMIMIFALSAVRATESNKVSVKDAGYISSKIVKDYDKKNYREQIDITATIHHLMRKAAHFAEFAILGAMITADIFLWFAPGNLLLFISSLVIGTVYAASDEIHQYYVPGRSCEFKDVLIDAAGVLGGVLFTLIVIYIVRRISSKKRTSEKKDIQTEA